MHSKENNDLMDHMKEKAKHKKHRDKTKEHIEKVFNRKPKKPHRQKNVDYISVYENDDYIEDNWS